MRYICLLPYATLTDRWPSEAGKSFCGCVEYVDGNLHDCAQYPKNCPGTHLNSLVTCDFCNTRLSHDTFLCTDTETVKLSHSVFRKMNVWKRKSLRRALALRNRTVRLGSSSTRTRGESENIHKWSIIHSRAFYPTMLITTPPCCLVHKIWIFN